jgi:hypothetical protein
MESKVSACLFQALSLVGDAGTINTVRTVFGYQYMSARCVCVCECV